MSARRRRRRRRSGGNNNNRQRQRKDARSSGEAFWGEREQLPDLRPDVRITDDPDAVPRSLGPPPLPGHESIAEHYFAVVYERAVTTAGALAAVGGLVEPEELSHDPEDEPS